MAEPRNVLVPMKFLSSADDPITDTTIAEALIEAEAFINSKFHVRVHFGDPKPA